LGAGETRPGCLTWYRAESSGGNRKSIVLILGSEPRCHGERFAAVRSAADEDVSSSRARGEVRGASRVHSLRASAEFCSELASHLGCNRYNGCMSGADTGSGTPLRWVAPEDIRLLREVIALADQERTTLGMFPKGAFAELARRKRLLAATEGDGVTGYALFDIARGRIRLIQLCVDPSKRGRGIARELVDAVSAEFPELSGIRLRCRADYDVNRLWPALGFVPVNEVPGRGRDAKSLVVWWRRHDVPDLFTDIDEEGELQVAIDHNVFIDLAVDRDRPGAAESQVLEADWLRDQVHLRATPETYREILQLERAEDRNRQRALLTRFAPLEPTTIARDDAASHLRIALGDLLREEDRADFNHVVSAAAAGVTVFLTRDESWISVVADAALDSLGVHVMRPSDIVAHLGELQDAERYQPNALHSTAITVEEPRAGVLREAATLLYRPGGERRTAFDRLLRTVAADPLATREVIRNADGTVLMVWAVVTSDEGKLTVPLLRAADAPLGATAVRQVLFRLRQLTLAARATRIDVTDAHIGQSVTNALVDDGFFRSSFGWSASVIDARSTKAATSALPADHPTIDELVAVTPESFPVERVSRLEVDLWPVKLLDTPMPNWIVAIQPRWARELFNLQDSLLERAPLLGISREHVYYRSPQGGPTAPARILWYASASGRDVMRSIVACSLLVEVVRDSPRRLHRRFHHLGVYRQTDVQARARDGVASALRFVGTERLRQPIPLERLRALNGNRQPGPLLSPVKITTELFEAVYREGTGRVGW
jgi:GNAT superfamily N-acetyltransferase